MANLILPRRFTQQPQYPVGIDRSNPLAHGLVAIFDPLSLRFGDLPPVGNTSLPRVGTSGVGVTTAAAGNKFIEFAHNEKFAQTGDLSLGFVFDVDALTDYSALISKEGTTTTNVPYELRAGSAATGSNFELLRANGSSYKSFAGVGNKLTVGQKNVRLVITAPSGIENAPTGYINGQKFSMPTASGSGTGASADNGTSKVQIGTRPDAVTYFDGGFYLVGIWNRQLTEPEAIEWTCNPWQIFRPRKQILYFDVTASTPTLSFATATSITATSAVPQVTLTF